MAAPSWPCPWDTGIKVSTTELASPKNGKARLMMKECNLFTTSNCSKRFEEITSIRNICNEMMHHSMLRLIAKILYTRPLIACHFPHWKNHVFISCTITEFCVISSLALDILEQNKNALAAAITLACLEIRSRNEEAINSTRNRIY